MGRSHVARTKNDNVLRKPRKKIRFRSKWDSGGRLSCHSLERSNKVGIGWGFEARLVAQGRYLHAKARIHALYLLDRAFQRAQNLARVLSRNGPPFEEELAFPGDNVLGCAALNRSYIDRRKRRIEKIMVLLLKE